ncbi:hypothetical protein K432DRAFT_20804 [Lepidopterella palustris CBS 459.81]|uniref:Uncharacterized protein n=1 Tax=Lepidopterella palustris CBS 459.81 TaxID=1314670 RepID=A0A8E2DWJ2_9PEZI|nr:hypothetical protein K432DRAFT_20804 [Lepidopterella palustris CBS 459.81]
MSSCSQRRNSMHVSQEHERILSRPAVFRCGQRPTNLAKHTRMAKRVWWPVILCKIESLKLSCFCFILHLLIWSNFCSTRALSFSPERTVPRCVGFDTRLCQYGPR